MILKKYKYLLAFLFAMLAAFLCVTGVSADDETPIVPIDPPDVTAIKFKSLPYKTQYLVGEKLDMSGAELELTYDTGATGSTPVKVSWATGFNSSKEGEQTVTVTYPDTKCKTTFTVTVVSEKSLNVVPPKTLTYFVGDTENRSGMTVSVVYSNGQTRELAPHEYTAKGFSTNTVGEKTVTISYKNLTASYHISVFEPALDKIEITKKPSKLSYFIGEKLDLSGMQVTAYYENGDTADVTSKVSVSGDVGTTGMKTVTVSYTESDHMKTASYNVTVIDVEVKNIVFVSYPNKMSYFEGETFDPLGISVSVTYNNGRVETVSEGMLYTGFDSDTVGKKTVTLHYGNFQLDFFVTVSVSPNHVHKESPFELTVPPTCTKEGIKSTSCTVCFEVVSTKTVEPKGHGEESMPVYIKAPTCTEYGATATYCMVCGEAATVTEIAPLGHTEGEAQFIKVPNCTEEGQTKTYCTVCGAEVNSGRVSPYGHTFGVWVMKAQPTGESEGREERTCSVCLTVESNIIPKLVHTITSSEFSATLSGETYYFPYHSNFHGYCVTDSLDATERAALTLSGVDGRQYRVLEVYDFAVSNSKGDAFIPDNGIIFTMKYALPYEEYSSFVVYREDFSEVVYFSDGEMLSLVCEGNGRYVLAGEILPEADSATSESDTENTGLDPDDSDAVSVSSAGEWFGDHLLTVIVIIAIILIVVIASCIYAYVFKQYY